MLFICCTVTIHVIAQSGSREFRDAQKNYLRERFPEAENNYRKSLEKKADPRTHYNLGNALYQQNRFEEAAGHYQKSLQMSKNKDLNGKAFYNLGNSLFNQEKYAESIEAYKNALKDNPDHLNARKNLSLAREMLKKQKQEQQQKNKEQESNKEQEQKQQDKQEQKNQDKKKVEQQSQTGEPAGEDKKGEENGSEEKRSGLDKNELNKLLDLIDEEDKNAQKKMRKGRDIKSKKDW